MDAAHEKEKRECNTSERKKNIGEGITVETPHDRKKVVARRMTEADTMKDTLAILATIDSPMQEVEERAATTTATKTKKRPIPQV